VSNMGSTSRNCSETLFKYLRRWLTASAGTASDIHFPPKECRWSLFVRAVAFSETYSGRHPAFPLALLRQVFFVAEISCSLRVALRLKPSYRPKHSAVPLMARRNLGLFRRHRSLNYR